jgi:hypothetical protein
MGDTPILYNFGANNAAIDQVNGNINSVQTVRTDIDNLFNILGTVYEGRGADALQQAHTGVSNMLDDMLQNMSVTQQQAADQQAAMQALDNQQAAQF